MRRPFSRSSSRPDSEDGGRRLLRLLAPAAGLVLVLFLAACEESSKSRADGDTDDGAGRAEYTSADCEFYAPPGYGAECGYLKVPQDRSDPTRRTARLHVAVFKSWGYDPAPDPIVYVDGGPGSNTLDSLEYFFDFLGAPFLAKRDVIFFDQRGTGYSRPSLECYDLANLEAPPAGTDQSEASARREYTNALKECRDTLSGRVTSLNAFSTKEIAADLEDLRKALGYDRWNVFGLSYGTKVALTAMRNYPDGIRSAVLDSAYPLEVNLINDTAGNLSRALKHVFLACEKDEDCADAYPDLEQTFRETVETLEDEPADIELFSDYRDFTDPSSEAPATTPFTASDFLSVLQQALYYEDLIPDLPQLISEVNDGNLDYASYLYDSLLYSDLNVGMYLSIQCAEEAAFTSSREVEREFARHAVIGRVLSLEYSDWTLGDCAAWDVEQADAASNEPVRSEIPTLVLAGEYDPITPPAWGKLVAENQRGSFFFEFPSATHGVTLMGRCPQKVMLDFIDHPHEAPEARCRERIPEIKWAVE